jgi:hypothetical protein
MRNFLLVLLASTILLSACGASPTASGPTPYVLEPLPTPRVAYQVIGFTKNTAMVVVDPASNTDRKGLQQIGDYLCSTQQQCIVWFWDDINKADSVFPVDPEKRQYTIAYYKFDWVSAGSILKVYTLGDPR